jgi:hypothetical protein
MVNGITIALMLLAVSSVLKKWRWALFVAVIVALAQDILRKLAPDQPVYYVLLVGIVFGVSIIGAMRSGVSLAPGQIWGWRRYLAGPVILFVAVLALQAVNALIRTRNPVIPLLGLTAYLTPFMALIVVHQMALYSRLSFFANFLRFYIICIFVALMTILLQYIGYDLPIFGEVGRGLIFFDRKTGAILSAYSGVFRSSEVAAWHAATCVCLFAIWIINRRLRPSTGVAAAVFVLVIVALGMLTGRRKFLVEIVVFASTYAALLLYFGRGAKLAVLAGLVGFLGYLAFTLWVPDSPTERALYRVIHEDKYGSYVARTKSVFGDIPERFSELGLAPVVWAYNRYGVLGGGLGIGSQGVQSVGGAGEGAAEGGLGKVWLELGAPGFVVITLVVLAFMRHILGVLNYVSYNSAPLNRFACGLVSFIVANVAAFTVATQVYGDIFVLLILGTALGFLLVMPSLIRRTALQEQLINAGLDWRTPPDWPRKLVTAGR